MKGLEQLRVLRLDDNRLGWVDMEVFRSTPVLTDLDLGDNQLTELITRTLTPLTQLRQLSLDGNQFKVQLYTMNIIYYYLILNIK